MPPLQSYDPRKIHMFRRNRFLAGISSISQHRINYNDLQIEMCITVRHSNKQSKILGTMSFCYLRQLNQNLFKRAKPAFSTETVEKLKHKL
jgi:hypothetical protein